MADHEQSAPVRAQETYEPSLGVAVQVVCRFVEEEHVATGEEDTGELEPAAFPTRQDPDGEVEAVVAQAEPGN
jgi:hypothetical protein